MRRLAVSAQAREKYSETLDISIRAAGVTGEEQMNLVVAGNVVETWTVGGDAYAGIFETYTVDIDGVDIDDVRIEFTNDLFDEANGIDRNLRVDNVSVDGVVYETEAPTVFSTGTWLPGEGVTPGFDESEFLHSNGYFQFADTSQGTGTEIRIAARGDEGRRSDGRYSSGGKRFKIGPSPTSKMSTLSAPTPRFRPTISELNSRMMHSTKLTASIAT